jgi:hypothetical protein
MTDPTAGTAPTPAEAVGPLIRGLTVLRRLALAGGARSVGDLVRDTGLARSTVDRVLGTLENALPRRAGAATLAGEVSHMPPLTDLDARKGGRR